MPEDSSPSSSVLSSPQSSPSNRPLYPDLNNPNDTIQVMPRPPMGLTQSTPAHVQHAPTATAPKPANGSGEAPKQRRPRKPRESKDGKPATTSTDKPKEKKPRKPREIKVKPEGAAAAAGTAPARKRQKSAPADEKPLSHAESAAGPRQSTLTEMMGHFQQQQPPAVQHQQPTTSNSFVAPALGISPITSSSQQPLASRAQISSLLQPTNQTISGGLTSSTVSAPPSQTPTPRPTNSGQRYDPIRGAMVDIVPARPASTASTGSHLHAHSPHAPKAPLSASASPSITSLIDPPYVPKTSTSPYVQPSQPVQQPPAQYGSSGLTQAAATASAMSALPSRTASQQSHANAATPTAVTQQPGGSSTSKTLDSAMDIDPPASALVPSVVQPAESKTAPTANVGGAAKSTTSSAAPTPKGTKTTQAKDLAKNAPVGTGSGLLSSSSLFGGGGANNANGTSGRRGVDIDIKISLSNTNNNINIAQLIAKQYGRDAINPRAAQHRERLLEVAAAASRLDPSLATDDMSLDLMDSDQDGDGDGGDSNVEMGGMTTDNNAETDKPARKKRRRKVEDYDKEDDFIDDTELAWEQHAKMSSDGFFVYAGPLIKDLLGAADAANGAGGSSSGGGPGSRGGRGRGRGSRGGRLANGERRAVSGTSGSGAAGGSETGRGRGRGRGGSGAPRKPRATKAEKAAAAAAAGNTTAPATNGGAAAAKEPSSLAGGTSSSALASQGPHAHLLSTGVSSSSSLHAPGGALLMRAAIS